MNLLSFVYFLVECMIVPDWKKKCIIIWYSIDQPNNDILFCVQALNFYLYEYVLN